MKQPLKILSALWCFISPSRRPSAMSSPSSLNSSFSVWKTSLRLFSPPGRPLSVWPSLTPAVEGPPSHWSSLPSVPSVLSLHLESLPRLSHVRHLHIEFDCLYSQAGSKLLGSLFWGHNFLLQRRKITWWLDLLLCKELLLQTLVLLEEVFTDCS